MVDTMIIYYCFSTIADYYKTMGRISKFMRNNNLSNLHKGITYGGASLGFEEICFYARRDVGFYAVYIKLRPKLLICRNNYINTMYPSDIVFVEKEFKTKAKQLGLLNDDIMSYKVKRIDYAVDVTLPYKQISQYIALFKKGNIPDKLLNDKTMMYFDADTNLYLIGEKYNINFYNRYDTLCIVSHPATLDYHLNNIAWDKIMHKARQLGYYSHTARTCGLHIHINRAALGASIEEQENTIGRIVFFFEKFWDKILRFSRRTEYQANHWASRYGGNTENPKETLKSAKSSGLGRYTAVNLENTFTVELRIFRGTLRYKTFVATLQFVDKLCNDAIKLSDEEFQTMTWSDFVGSIKDMPELQEYLKIRGLEE